MTELVPDQPLLDAAGSSEAAVCAPCENDQHCEQGICRVGICEDGD